MIDLTDAAQQVGRGWITVAAALLALMVAKTHVDEWQSGESNRAFLVGFVAFLVALSYWFGG